MQRQEKQIDFHVSTTPETQNDHSNIKSDIVVKLFRTDLGNSLQITVKSIAALSEKYNHLHMHIHNYDEDIWHPVNISAIPEKESNIESIEVYFPDIISQETKSFGIVLILTTGQEQTKSTAIAKISDDNQFYLVSNNYPANINLRFKCQTSISDFKEFLKHFYKASIQNSKDLIEEISFLITNPYKSINLKSRINSDSALFNIPSLANRTRVASHVANLDEDGSIFLKRGFVKAKLITQIYEAISGEAITDKTSVLDWGVGCGSIARYMIPTESDFYGIDIDQVNIDWCSKNLSPGKFIKIDPYENELQSLLPKFDLIYSFSVMTHLKQDLQIHWIKQLASISKGLMIISIHGVGKLIREKRDITDIVNLVKTKSFHVGVPNPDIADQDPDGTYTDVSNSYENIVRNWSPHVEILDFINDGHDYVICRPK